MKLVELHFLLSLVWLFIIGRFRVASSLCFKPRLSAVIYSCANNSTYYSFKIFPQFWLAKSTRLIHHNQLLMTRFGRILYLTRKWRRKCSPLQVNAPLTEKTWERGWVVLVVKKKWRTFHSFLRVRTTAGTRWNNN